ncbi:MAG: inorganic pyrophosphatase [Actinomycetota bacterium]
MNNWNSQSAGIEWVDQAYELLIEIARCSLSEHPKLPDHISQKALPLIQKVQSIQETGQGLFGSHSGWQHRDRQWVEQVGQLLIEITRISLAEQPKLPENLAQRALTLAEEAQNIKETAQESETPTGGENDSSLLPPDSLLSLLQESLKQQRAKSSNPEAPEWQELLSLLNVAQGIYKRIS